MKDIIIIVFLISGSLMILISSIGIVRMPDLYTRLSHISKANPIGIGAMLIALVFAFSDNTDVMTRSIVAFIFLVISIPVAGHFLARVGYFIGIEKVDRMVRDDLERKFGSRKKSDEA